MQSVPDLSQPVGIVEPCKVRMDLSAITRDIVGFKRLGAAAHEWWQEYLQEKEELDQVSETNTSCTPGSTCIALKLLGVTENMFLTILIRINSSAPRSKPTSFVIDIFSKSEGCVEKYLKKFCLG